MNEPKFKIGQLVKFINDDDTEAGDVLGFYYDPAFGYTYKISAREVDLVAKKVINGSKICREEELVSVEEPHA